MVFSLGDRSRVRLLGVHPDLVRVVELAVTLSVDDFTVGEGVRTLERQRHLVEQGHSRTMKSRHLSGHAVDLWVLLPSGVVTWEWSHYELLAQAMRTAAKMRDVPIEWGGDLWAHCLHPFYDGPHFQLPASRYPS